MPQADITTLIGKFKERRILVVGDVMLDRWTYGRVTRLSPEAPVPILEKTGEKYTLGGAANVAHNLSTLGAQVFLAGVVGSDRNAETLRALLEAQKIDDAALITSQSRPTTEKHRIVSRGDHQFLRLDHEETSPLSYEDEEALWSAVMPIISRIDGIIFSDYAKGVLSQTLAQRIIAEAKARGVPTFADFKPKNKKNFIGVDLISPNLKEGREMTGLEARSEVGMKLAQEFSAYVALTLGEDGISVFKKGDGEEFHVPGKKIGVADVSGAGDTAIAALALALTSGLPVVAAAALANDASAAVVQKPGTATLSPEELSSAMQVGSHVGNLPMVPKAWGYEKWVENNEKYCCKILSVNRGYRCSLHYHKEKDETFYMTQGHIKLEIGDEVRHLYPGSFIRIPPGTQHRFTAIEDSFITEISTHHKEEDSFRLEESGKAPEDSGAISWRE